MTIREHVLEVLQKFPETRNDDRKLYIKVLEAMGLAREHHPSGTGAEGLFIFQVDLDKLPAFEAVIRRRAEIQNEEQKFIPTDPEVLQRRRLYIYFHHKCPRELLFGEMEELVARQGSGNAKEMLEAICRRCPKLNTDDCQFWKIHA